MQKPAAEYSVNCFDIAYCADPLLLARVYQPQGVGPFPIVVEVHGGGWGSGDRLNDHALNTALARSGVIVAAIDFRLSGQAKFPASVADVNLAIRWLKQCATKFGGKPSAVGGVGSSSGGHKLLLNALRPSDTHYCTTENLEIDEHDASLSFVVACWPVADPWARYQMALKQQRAALIQSHVSYWNSDEEMIVGSPQHILERREQTHLPPLLILQGSADENLTPDMSERFAAQYVTCGGSAELALFDNQPHAFISRHPESNASRRAISLISDFIHANNNVGTACGE